MVAYSCKPRFVIPILVGLDLITPGDGEILVNGFSVSTFVRKKLPEPKRHTIRAHGKRRHARIGEELQLYTGMRTKSCRLIARTRCSAVDSIIIWTSNMAIMIAGKLLTAQQIVAFAKSDGFVSPDDMQQFWAAEHPGVDKFEGVIIRWEPL